jgi:NDP-sugar pyrophosphorylase family protein
MGVSAAILAGGLGTRLRGVINDRPKVTAPVAGVPFISHLIRQLGSSGIRDVVLLVGYAADQIRAELGDRHRGVNLGYSEERELLGTGGAVRLALPLLRGKSVLLLNGDSYCDVDLRGFQQHHNAREAAVSMTLTFVEDAARFGRVETGPEDRIVRFEEKQPRSAPGWINAGVYLIERELLESVPAKTALSLERDLLPGWVSTHTVLGFRGEEFIDIGVPQSYARADSFFAARPAAV